MFKFSEKQTCWWPVRVKVPSETKPGTFDEQEFEIQLELQDRERSRAQTERRIALTDKIREAAEAGDVSAMTKSADDLDQFDQDEFRSVILGWRGIEGDEGEFPFSPDNLKLLLNRSHVRAGISQAYREAIGEDRARLGN